MRKLASLPFWSRTAKQLTIGNEADDRRAIESTSTHDLLAPSFLSLHDNHLNLPPSIVEVGIPPVCAVSRAPACACATAGSRSVNIPPSQKLRIPAHFAGQPVSANRQEEQHAAMMRFGAKIMPPTFRTGTLSAASRLVPGISASI